MITSETAKREYKRETADMWGSGVPGLKMCQCKHMYRGVSRSTMVLAEVSMYCALVGEIALWGDTLPSLPRGVG